MYFNTAFKIFHIQRLESYDPLLSYETVIIYSMKIFITIMGYELFITIHLKKRTMFFHLASDVYLIYLELGRYLQQEIAHIPKMHPWENTCFFMFILEQHFYGFHLKMF